MKILLFLCALFYSVDAEDSLLNQLLTLEDKLSALISPGAKIDLDLPVMNVVGNCPIHPANSHQHDMNCS